MHRSEETVKAFVPQLLDDIINNRLLIESDNVELNVFVAEGIERDEVKMCRFLHALLSDYYNPKYGKQMRETFLTRIMGFGEEKVGDGKNWYTEREYLLPDGRRVDIALINTKQNVFIPIEAKIYAKDKSNQCKDYIDYANKEYNFLGWKLGYLTIDGKLPSIDSCSKEYHEQIKLISWENIKEWLTDTKVENDEGYKWCLKQFVGAISKFTKNEKDKKHMIKIINTEDQLSAAEYICQHINDVKQYKMKEFYSIIENEIDKNIKKNGNEELLIKKELRHGYACEIDDYYSKRTYPGITYFVEKMRLKDEYRHALGEHDLAIRIETDSYLYVGVCCPLIENNDYSGYGNHGLDGVRYTELQKLNFPMYKQRRIEPSNWWLGWDYVNDKNEYLHFKGTENTAFKYLFDFTKRDRWVELVISKFNLFCNIIKEMIK